MSKRISYIILAVLLIGVAIFTIAINYYTKTEQNVVVTSPAPTKIIEEEHGNNIALEIVINQSDVELIAKTVYGEARGCTVEEQSAVVWCILNRVDAGYGTIEKVITAPYQFTGYRADNPVKAEFTELAVDVLLRWHMEKYAIGEVGRTLPDEYLWFHGDGKYNYFRNKYSGDYITWDWECINPYP